MKNLKTKSVIKARQSLFNQFAESFDGNFGRLAEKIAIELGWVEPYSRTGVEITEKGWRTYEICAALKRARELAA